MEKELLEIGQLDPKFHDIFSDDELLEILHKAMAYSEKVIIITTEQNFFELSADLGDSLEIYADFHGNLDSGRVLDKETFLYLLRSSPPMEAQTFTVDV